MPPRKSHGNAFTMTNWSRLDSLGKMKTYKRLIIKKIWWRIFSYDKRNNKHMSMNFKIYKEIKTPIPAKPT